MHSHVLHVLVVTPLAMRLREDGVLFLWKRFPMINRLLLFNVAEENNVPPTYHLLRIKVCFTTWTTHDPLSARTPHLPRLLKSVCICVVLMTLYSTVLKGWV